MKTRRQPTLFRLQFPSEHWQNLRVSEDINKRLKEKRKRKQHLTLKIKKLTHFYSLFLFSLIFFCFHLLCFWMSKSSHSKSIHWIKLCKPGVWRLQKSHDQWSWRPCEMWCHSIGCCEKATDALIWFPPFSCTQFFFVHMVFY